jgi:hypothetical protein
LWLWTGPQHSRQFTFESQCNVPQFFRYMLATSHMSGARVFHSTEGSAHLVSWLLPVAPAFVPWRVHKFRVLQTLSLGQSHKRKQVVVCPSYCCPQPTWGFLVVPN